jgi:hypothetical protein
MSRQNCVKWQCKEIFIPPADLKKIAETTPLMSRQAGTRITALIGTILDMKLLVTLRATMVEVNSAWATEWAVDTRSLQPREMQATTL